MTSKSSLRYGLRRYRTDLVRERHTRPIRAVIGFFVLLTAHIRRVVRFDSKRRERNASTNALGPVDLDPLLHGRRAPAHVMPAIPESLSIPAPDLTQLEGFNGRFSLLIAGPLFGAHVFPHACAAMQSNGSKIVDLTAATVGAVGHQFFAAVAQTWSAPASRVPRIAVVLSFDRWAVARETAKPCIAALAEHGVEMVLFYQEQGSLALAQWLIDGVVRHDVELAIRTLLRDSWIPTGTWPMVVAAAAELVYREVRPEHVPRLLSCLSGIALSCGDALIAEPLARDAVIRAGMVPSPLRALALRTLGATLIQLGHDGDGIHLLELAVATADLCDAPPELAAALCHCGMYHIAHGNNETAEHRFRRAVEVAERSKVGGDTPGVAHHGLALALLRRGDDGAAAIHAARARAARRDPHPFAELDRALLAELQARRDRAN
jgi:hypothetical protein